jgi:hypothetical protein
MTDPIDTAIAYEHDRQHAAMNEKREMLIRALQHRGEYEAASEIQNLQAQVLELEGKVLYLTRHNERGGD